MAIHSVELWLKGLAAAIGGAARPKTTPRPGEALYEPVRSEQCRHTSTLSGEPSGTSVDSPTTPVQ